MQVANPPILHRPAVYNQQYPAYNTAFNGLVQQPSYINNNNIINNNNNNNRTNFIPSTQQPATAINGPIPANAVSTLPRVQTISGGNYVSYHGSTHTLANTQRVIVGTPTSTSTATVVQTVTTAAAPQATREAGSDYSKLTPGTKKPALVVVNKKSQFKCLIDGKLEESATSYEVINPATGKTYDLCPNPSLADLERAITAGKAAYKTWSQTTQEERLKCFQAATAAIKANLDAIAEILACEQGKPLAKAKEEVGLTAAWFEITSSYKIKEESLPSLDGSITTTFRRPLGLTAGIIPWNFPVVLAAWKICPSLWCGNTIIIKPSPFTPLSTLKLGEVLKDVFPPGVLQILSGDDSFGAAITKHQAFAKISFTGSAQTGKRIMASAAETLKRVTLELGGNDAAIILPDSNIKEIAPKIFLGAMSNTGQVCAAIKRIYVHKDQYESLCEELAACAKAAKVGEAHEEGVEFGPLNNKMQYDRVLELIEDSKKAGGKIFAGGNKVEGRDGYFIQPTIIGGLKDSDRLVEEEQFGPVVPVLTYETESEALERANKTLFGLCGSVWSSDVEKATAMASKLETATAWVNQHLALCPFAPFGGAKCSGIGFDNGEHSLDGWCQLQTMIIRPTKKD
jgi:acyl-CoA reductase-like NAD-dependent aldehyde dehydrogenase